MNINWREIKWIINFNELGKEIFVVTLNFHGFWRKEFLSQTTQD